VKWQAMKKEYDFSKGVRGRFHRVAARLNLPKNQFAVPFARADSNSIGNRKGLLQSGKRVKTFS
jgi:hypothetical protein